MFCKYCGTENKDGAVFCKSCGKQLAAVATQPNEKNGMKPLLILGCIAAVAVIATCALVAVRTLGSHDPETQEMIQTEDVASEIKENGEGDSDAEEPMVDVPVVEGVPAGEAEPILAEFGINPDTVTDYANALEPTGYRRYNSSFQENGARDFSFYYPAQLYENVVVTDEGQNAKFGGSNVRTITFSGSEGSVLQFSLTRRNDSASLKQMTETVHTAQTQMLNEPNDILYRARTDYGKSIVTGWLKGEEGMAVYDLCKIEQDYVLQMFACFPGYVDETDRLQKAYVVENLYRMCGFSDSSQNVRSYEEFLRESGQ